MRTHIHFGIKYITLREPPTDESCGLPASKTTCGVSDRLEFPSPRRYSATALIPVGFTQTGNMQLVRVATFGACMYAVEDIMKEDNKNILVRFHPTAEAPGFLAHKKLKKFYPSITLGYDNHL